VAPGEVDRAGLVLYLRTIRENADETRERRMFALAGLAGLGESVLPAIRTAASDKDLTVREQLMLGLGAASLGDAATARSILALVATANGEQSGSLARLRVGTTAADITAGTALAAALAAAVGDPLAGRFWAYVEANPAADRIEVLPAIAFASHMLDRLPVAPAKVAWAVDGTRHVVDLGHGQSLQLVLTAAQLASLTIDRLGGAIGVSTEWREAVAASTFTPDPDMTITRSVEPASPIHAADLVVVDLNVTFSAQASDGCRQVTELVPSGLAPVGAESRWYDTENEDVPPDDGLILPYDQSGSRVFFCVGPSATRRTFTLRYVARVVTLGKHRELETHVGRKMSIFAGDLFVDGSLGSRTAALRLPYTDAPGCLGHPYLDAEQVGAHVAACTEVGVQAGFHVIGDAAADTLADGLRRAARRSSPAAVRARAHRVEHLEMVDAAQMATLAELGVIASVQPVFDAWWGGPSGMYVDRLGDERARAMNPFAALLAAGVPLAFGSDAPVTPLGPWAAVRAAIGHRTAGSGVPEEVALVAHTTGGHRAAGESSPLAGRLVPGAPASYAVWELGDDLGDEPRCLRTVQDGRVLHDTLCGG
jgi:hypothetical protein